MRLVKHGNNTRIWLSSNDTERWATKPGASWPCSQCRGNRLFVELLDGDIVDFTMNGKSADIDSNELNAILDDHLQVNP